MKEKELLQNLLSENAQLRQTATKALWNLWLSQAGEKAESRIRTGTKQMDRRQYELAQQEFENLVMDYPKFAEAHNKLATVLYMQRKYVQSIRECEMPLEMNPNILELGMVSGFVTMNLPITKKLLKVLILLWFFNPMPTSIKYISPNAEGN